MSPDVKLRSIAQHPENRRCFDCGNLGTTFVVPNPINIFVCTECSGSHMKIGHRVKSMSMSKFTEAEVSALEAGGNGAAQRTWLANWKSEGNAVRPADKNPRKLDAWVSTVFLDRRYFGRAPAAPAATQHRSRDADQIPLRPLSDVLGSASGSVKLTVSPSPSLTSSPSVASPSPALSPATNTTTGPTSTAAASPGPRQSGVAAAPFSFSTALPPSAPASTSLTHPPPAAVLGFTDNAFGPPGTTSTPPGPHASTSPSAASSFDPFGSFVNASPSGSLPAPPASTHMPAPAAAPSPVPFASGWIHGSAPGHIHPQATGPAQLHARPPSSSSGGPHPPHGAAPGLGSRSSGGAAPAPGIAAVTPTSLHPHQQPQSVRQTTSSSSGFNDDADWGAFTFAPPGPAAAHASAPTPAAPVMAPAAPSSQNRVAPAPQPQPQSQPQDQPAASGFSHAAPSSGGASGGGASSLAAPQPRSELPSDLFSEPLVVPGMGMMGLGVGVGGIGGVGRFGGGVAFGPMVGAPPPLGMPPAGPLPPHAQPQLPFPGAVMPGAGVGVGAFPFPGARPASMPAAGMGVGPSLGQPGGMVGGLPGLGLAPGLGGFPFPQPGMVPGGRVPTANGLGGTFAPAGAFSFGQMGAALPAPGLAQQAPPAAVSGNPFA